MSEPTHPDSVTWAFVGSPDIEGTGACGGVTARSVLQTIWTAFPDLADIDTVQPIDPTGIPVFNAGPAQPANEPAFLGGTDEHILVLMDGGTFAFVFVRGSRCSGQSCLDSQRWYFETDDDCSPRWVGYYQEIQRDGCVDVSGDPLWGLPGARSLRSICGADLSPRDISGEYPVTLLMAFTATLCDGSPVDGVVPATLAITQTADLATASAEVRDSGIPLIDDVSLSGNVEYTSFEATVETPREGSCSITRQYAFQFEGEANDAFGGLFFAILDVTESLGTDCSPTDVVCTDQLSVHFAHR